MEQLNVLQRFNEKSELVDLAVVVAGIRAGTCDDDGSCGLSSLETCQQYERKITVWRNQGFKLPGQSFPVLRR